MGATLVSITTVVHEVEIVNVNGQVQFTLWVAAPPSRIAEELLPLLTRGGAEDGWTAQATGRRRDIAD